MPKPFKLHHFLAPVAAVLFTAAPASAQEADGGMTVTVGGGVYFEPEFPGAKNLAMKPWPNFGIRRRGTDPDFETSDEGIAFGLIGNQDFRIGPTVQFNSGRDEEDSVPGIGDVGFTVEGGAFAEAFLSDSFRLRGEVRQGFGGHKGIVADIGADAIIGRDEALALSIGPRLRLANGRYVRAFFGVNPEQSIETGLPIHDADGGLHAVGLLAEADYKLSDRIGMVAYGRFDRLMGDAADSPLVWHETGSKNQYGAGIALTYDFDIR